MIVYEIKRNGVSIYLPYMTQNKLSDRPCFFMCANATKKMYVFSEKNDSIRFLRMNGVNEDVVVNSVIDVDLVGSYIDGVDVTDVDKIMILDGFMSIMIDFFVDADIDVRQLEEGVCEWKHDIFIKGKLDRWRTVSVQEMGMLNTSEFRAYFKALLDYFNQVIVLDKYTCAE